MKESEKLEACYKPLTLAIYNKGSLESIRKERARLNRDSLTWLYGRVLTSYFVLSYVSRQLKEGDSLIAECLQIPEAELPEKGFPGNAIETLLSTIKGHIDYLEQPAIQKLIEEALKEEQCEEIY